MADPVELSGTWWLPDSPDHRVGGVLTIDDGAHITLKATAALPRAEGEWLIDAAALHGAVEGHRLVTLLHVQEIKGPPLFSAVSYEGSEFTADVATVGALLTATEPLFESVCFELTNLNEWCNVDRGISVSTTDGRHRIEAQQGDGRDPIRAVVDEKVSIELRFANQPLVRFDRSYGIASRPYFKITIVGGATLDAYEEIVKRLQELITLLVHTPVYVTRRWGKPVATDVQEVGLAEEVAIYRSHSRRVPPDYKVRFPQGMMAPLSLVESDLPGMIASWITEAPRFGHTYHMYFAVAFQRHGYFENRFLGYVQAVEGFHRRFVGKGRYVTKAEFKGVVKEIEAGLPNDLDPDLRKSIINKVQEANRWSLRDRLRQLLDRRSSTFREAFFGAEEEQAAFIRSVAETRDDYAHGLEPGEVKHTFGDDYDAFATATERLQVLVEASLLEVAGLAPERIEQLLRNRPVSGDLIPNRDLLAAVDHSDADSASDAQQPDEGEPEQ